MRCSSFIFFLSFFSVLVFFFGFRCLFIVSLGAFRTWLLMQKHIQCDFFLLWHPNSFRSLSAHRQQILLFGPFCHARTLGRSFAFGVLKSEKSRCCRCFFFIFYFDTETHSFESIMPPQCVCVCTSVSVYVFVYSVVYLGYSDRKNRFSYEKCVIATEIERLVIFGVILCVAIVCARLFARSFLVFFLLYICVIFSAVSFVLSWLNKCISRSCHIFPCLMCIKHELVTWIIFSISSHFSHEIV